MSIPVDRINGIIDKLLKGIMLELKTEKDYAFVGDSVVNVVRSRVNAEVCSALVNLHNHKVANYKSLIEKLTKWLIRNQNSNGSWNEKHVNIDAPSIVFTSTCALSLLDVKEGFSDIVIPDNVFENAANFLIKQEISNGHFRKSEYYHADILNADAMVAAFLVRLGVKYQNDEYLKAGKRAISNVCAQQFTDGSYPYGGPTRAYPYKYHLYVPCIHYQTITLHYLLKSLPFIKSDFLEHSIDVGIKWLLANQYDNGTFNWRNSGLNFALYLTATYALTIPLYKRYMNKDERAEKMISKSLDVFEKQIFDGVLLRWEKGEPKSFIKGMFDALGGGFIGEYPFSYKILRSLHRIHREIARSKVSKNMTVSKLTNRSVGYYSAFLSSVESSTNYPDLYMTTQALEALSSVLTNGVTDSK